MDELFQTSDASTFTVLSATLTTNYAREIHHLRQIRDQFGGRLPERVFGSINDLIDRLQDIDIARQYFKTLYLQEELSVLSRLRFYVGLPSVGLVAVGLYMLTASNGASVPRPDLAIIVPAITTIGLLPLIVLFAFVLRLATVTQRTAATLPFTTPSQEK